MLLPGALIINVVTHIIKYNTNHISFFCWEHLSFFEVGQFHRCRRLIRLLRLWWLSSEWGMSPRPLHRIVLRLWQWLGANLIQARSLNRSSISCRCPNGLYIAILSFSCRAMSKCTACICCRIHRISTPRSVHILSAFPMQWEPFAAIAVIQYFCGSFPLELGWRSCKTNIPVTLRLRMTVPVQYIPSAFSAIALYL